MFPIDFAAVAAVFQERFARHTHDIKPLFDRLGEAIKLLDRSSLEAERATRSYPLLRYRDDAVCLTVDSRLMPPLPRAAGAGFGEGLVDGWHRFAGEIGYVKTAVDQELAIPRMLGPFMAMTSDILASMERFEKPTSQMFDPNNARFSDLFGVANLGWSSMLGSANQNDLRAIARGVRAAVGAPDGTTSPVAGALAPPAPPSSGPPFQSLIDTFDETTKMIFDIVLFLPVVSLAIDVLINEGTLVAELEILTQLTSIESEVYDIRTSIVDELIHYSTLGSLAQAGLDVAETWAGMCAFILAAEIPRYTGDLLDGMFGFLAGVSSWGTWIVDLVEAARSMFEALMNVDLMDILMHLLFPPWVVKILPSPPSVTIDDIIGLIIGVGATAIRTTLDTWLSGAEDVLYWTPFARHYSYKIGDLRSILLTVLSPSPFTYPPDVMPTTALAGFPDIYESLFGGGRRALLLSSIDTFGVELRGSVGGIFTGAGTMANELSGLARGELDRMATAGSGVNLARLGDSSVVMARGVFGPERDALMARQRQPSPLAAAFDEVMAGSGIAIAAALIPIYVGGIRKFWAARSQGQEHPTSAHILAKNGRLAMVQVPRLTVNASGRQPDEALADTLNGTFRTVVTTAYHEGRQRVVELAKPMGAPVARSRVTGGKVGGR